MINYAEKYSSVVDERFKLGALTNQAVNNDYEFTGVDTIKISSVPTAPMNDYKRQGSNRYGEPAELENELQSLVLSQDRSFTFTIDRASHDDAMMTIEAGKALRRQVDEVVIPEIDQHRLKKIAEGAVEEHVKVQAITSSNAFKAFLNADAALTEAKVPITGRVGYVTPLMYAALKEDKAFILPSNMAQEMLVKGVVGMVDGTPIVRIPTIYVPENVQIIITHPSATTGAQKLAQYKIHDNPPGINGWLVEGRVRYDAFVLKKKAPAIYVHKSA